MLGARFKTKLVLAFLSLALTPAILIFIIASNFINTSIEGWFKPQVERPLDQALEVAQTYYQGQEAMALRHARYMADVLAREGFMAPAQRTVLSTYLTGQQERLGLAAITVFNRAGQPVLHAKDVALATVPTRSVNKEQLRRGLSGQEVTTVHELDDGDMIQAIVPIKSGDRALLGAIVVGTYVPQRLETRLRTASASPSRSTSSCVYSASPSRASKPALPPYDPRHRVLGHVVRPVPRSGYHRARATMLAEGTRAVARATQLQRSRCAPTTSWACSWIRSTA